MPLWISFIANLPLAQAAVSSTFHSILAANGISVSQTKTKENACRFRLFGLAVFSINMCMCASGADANFSRAGKAGSI